jgi:hypothetical protein
MLGLSAHEMPALTWRKSSASDSDDCVEVAITEGMIMVRDSKNRHGGQLAFSSNGWGAFLAAVRQDIPGPPV